MRVQPRQYDPEDELHEVTEAKPKRAKKGAGLEQILQKTTEDANDLKQSMANALEMLRKRRAQDIAEKNSEQALLQTQQERANLTLDAENARNQIKELSLKKLGDEKLSRSELSTIENQVNEAQRALDSLLESKKLTTSLVSPFDGRVVEIKAGVGSLIAQGSL